MTVAAILLAAGKSRRFGADDKLLADFNGMPLVGHAAQAIREFSPDHMIAVTTSQAVAIYLSDFEIVRPRDGANKQSDSLKAGVAVAERFGCKRVIVALGDMPRVTPRLLADVVSKANTDQPSAAFNGKTVMPPACFPSSWFSQIELLEGDRGGISLLQDLPESQLVFANPEKLYDIDTPEDIAQAL